MGGINNLWFHLLIVLAVATIAQSYNDCVYTVYVKTGSIVKGGTDSNISLALYNSKGKGIRIPNLEAWGGLMGPNYNYFERGNLDIFSGRGPCVTGPMCSMNLTSDGSGLFHGWYCNYVEVTLTGDIPCTQQRFMVNQWLALDTSPYQLTAIRNKCASSGDGKDHDGNLNVINGSDSPVQFAM